MRRSKHGPALFELIGENELRARPGGAAFAEPQTPPEGEAEPPIEGQSRPAPDEPLRTQAKEAGDKTPVVEFDGDRVRFSLTSAGAAVVSFLAILLVVGGFMLGHKRGRDVGLDVGYEAGRSSYVAETGADIEAARQQAPATYLIGGLLEPPPASAASAKVPTIEVPAPDAGPVDAAAAWVDGFTYVVAQEFPSGSRSDAEAAQTYLADRGVGTAVVAAGQGRLQLITTQGFNRKDPMQRKLSDEYLEKVRAIGAQYYAGGGRYKLEGYLKTYKNET